MSSKDKFSARRRSALKKSLKGAAAVGAVSATGKNWKTPLVKSVVLPAHASSSKSISISSLEIRERETTTDPPAPGEITLSAVNPANGSNLGLTLYDGSADYGRMNVSGVISPPPPPGTEVEVVATTSLTIDNDTSGEFNCFFRNPSPCRINLNVNSFNGDFSLINAEVNGLDDNFPGTNPVTLTFTCMDAPPFVLNFSLNNGS